MANCQAINLKSSQVYTSCYCEENVWQLCKKIKDSKKLPSTQEKEFVFVVFISNENKTVPLWKQSAAEDPEHPVVWDYHVILINKVKEGSMVFDLDTNLLYPCEFSHYSNETFKTDELLREQFHRKFRVINIDDFLMHFASDRSHMKAENGDWIKPPPLYPCIQTSQSSNNITNFVSVDPNVGWGDVHTLKSFNERFLENHSR